MRPLLALCAILKDEAHNIESTLESALPFVDLCVISDTGSTDDTVVLVQKTCERFAKPLVLLNETFTDYSSARNKVLDAHDELGEGRAYFTLMLSGDEKLIGGAALRAFLEGPARDEGAYLIEMLVEHARYDYPRVLRADAKWRYQGAIQEVPVAPTPDTFPGDAIHNVAIEYKMSDPERRLKRLILRDVPLLSKAVEDGAAPLHQRAQALFHLAEATAAIAAELPDDNPLSSKLTRQLAAASYFYRYGQLAEAVGTEAHDPDKAIYAYALYLNLMQNTQLFLPEEMFMRLDAVAKQGGAKDSPEIAYMRAATAAQIDIRKAALLAVEAANVARRRRSVRSHVPTDTRIEWMSWRMAAACAKQLKRAPTYVQELVAHAREAGAPPESLADLV